MNHLHKLGRSAVCAAFLGIASLTQVHAAVLESGTEETFGTFDGVEYIRYTGRFSGETPQGRFRMPYEIVAPADPADGSGTVVIEPPHFSLGLPGRDVTLGPGVLFEHGISHATVGFGEFQLNILDPDAQDAMIGGEPAAFLPFPGARDVEIVEQFARALRTDPYARDLLGRVDRRYAFGVSQSAEVLFEIQYAIGADGLFDLTVMHVPLWRPPFAEPAALAALPEEFVPLRDIGKVMIVSSEGDRIISGYAPFRRAVDGAMANRNYRLYEVAGAPHLPLDIELAPGFKTNPLDIADVVRAAFVSGHRWVRWEIRPPRTALLQSSEPGEIDPITMDESGIARDANGNALGGVRYPDVELGRALFVASSPEAFIPGFPGLVGTWADLACAPAPGDAGDSPRFKSHRQYVRGVARQSLRLLLRGYLLPADARRLIREAVDSDVGRPGSCDQ